MRIFPAPSEPSRRLEEESDVDAHLPGSTRTLPKTRILETRRRVRCRRARSRSTKAFAAFGHSILSLCDRFRFGSSRLHPTSTYAGREAEWWRERFMGWPSRRLDRHLRSSSGSSVGNIMLDIFFKSDIVQTSFDRHRLSPTSTRLAGC